MEAANRGCQESGGLSIGLGIRLPEEQRTNRFVQREYDFRYFFVRKLMFVKYSCAFLVFPGGFGTLDALPRGSLRRARQATPAPSPYTPGHGVMGQSPYFFFASAS
jgi:hypothetical protein